MPRKFARVLAVTVAAVALSPRPAVAQAAMTNADSASVYQAYPWLDGTVVGAATLIVVAGYVGGPKLVHPSCPCDAASLNALDRHVVGNESGAARVASDISIGVVLGAPLVLDLVDVGASRTFVEDAVVFGEALMVSEALATVTKFAVQRPRPSTYAGQGDGSADDYVSFYSSHSTKAFAALSVTAMTLDLRHGQHIWPWAVAGIVGTSVAAERVAAGRHFYSDVLVGALTGLATGIVVPLLHERRSASSTSASSLSLSAAPLVAGTPLIGLSGTF